MSSLLTSLIEAPMEMFRHRVQVRMQAVWPRLGVLRNRILPVLLLLQHNLLMPFYWLAVRHLSRFLQVPLLHVNVCQTTICWLL